MDHLRHVKRLPHFFFEPGGMSCVSSNENITFEKWTANSQPCMDDAFIQKGPDLWTNPFKGGGDDATWISSDVKGLRNITSMRIRRAGSKSLDLEAVGFQQSLNRYFWNDKGLQCYVFEPGWNIIMSRIRRMQVNQIINEFVLLEGLDLRTNPFKGGGDDAILFSSIRRLDPAAFKGAYLANQRELGNKVNCSGKLTHQSIFTNWSHHNDIKGLRVMKFTIWMNQDFRRTDISSLRRVFRPNQKGSGYDSKCFRFLSHQGTREKWNLLKRRWE